MNQVNTNISSIVGVSMPTIVMDVDGHEFSPSHLWGTVFGGMAEKVAAIAEPMLRTRQSNDQYNPSVEGDVTEINAETVWSVRGVKAPGAFDFSRRLAAHDEMGIARQLVFPSYGIFAMLLLEEGIAPAGSSRAISLGLEGSEMSAKELGDLGVKAVDEYNDWAVQMTALNPDRLRMVAYVKPADTVDYMVEQARYLIDRGIRAVQITFGRPPAGLSPASPEMDPFWAILAENNVTCTIHVGGDPGYLSSFAWKNAPAFALGKSESYELGLEPYSFSTLHHSTMNFLTCLVMGGVFERHPTLRFGAFELGVSWLGPFAESLDMWATGPFKRRLEPYLSMLPSEYIARNVRVCPYNDVESVEVHFRRYPNLASCYCYGSDYPHMEGGWDSKRKAFERVAELGQDIVDKFFVENAKWVMPD